ncbi:MAG: ChbG/HpnK family deacetylase [Armatimonadetes bacterium]|nr:ChbG/HpnK family deacetylase [Armatimonadota bacterium]
MTPAPRVILHAEAFGRHSAINEGVERAHRYGLVTSAGLMAAGDALEDAVRRAREMPSLDLGLHLVLHGSDGRPLGFRQFPAAWLHGEVPVREIAGQLRQQLDLLLRVHRLSLSHIASHGHVHAFPPVMRVVCAVAMEYGIPAVRLPADAPPPRFGHHGRRRPVAALRAAARLARRHITAYGLRTADHCAGLALEGRLTAVALAAYLRHVRPGVTEIICHPGADNRVLRQTLGGDYDWERDLAAVCDEAVRSYLTPGQVHLATWRDV